MITITFEDRKNGGLCETIFSSIKSQILKGSLKADEKLPSKRALAQNLGVSVITVQNAYSQLISEGYIYSIEKKGFFVTDLPLQKGGTFSSNSGFFSPNGEPSRPDREKAEESECAAQNENTSGTENPQQGNSQPILDFKNNATSYEKFPFNLWSHTMRQVLNSGDENLLRRTEAKGVLELRIQLARYLKAFRNMQVSPEQIVIGAGTENLYALIVQILGREKIYAVENPGYHKAEAVFRLNGVNTVPVKLDEQGLSPTELEKSKADVVHLSPSHHFPSGIVMPIRRRQEILAWSLSSPEHYIIEDDYDSEFRFNGKPLPTLQSSDSGFRVIYVNTFSKTLAPSFRISYMVLPAQLVPVFNQKIGIYSCPVSSFEQYTLARFIQQGYFEKHIIRMKNYYRNLRNALITAINNSALSKIAHIQEEEAGLHFLLKVDTNLTQSELVARLNECGINLPLLSDFYYGAAPSELDKTFVVNYSGLKRELIPQIVDLLEKATAQ